MQRQLAQPDIDDLTAFLDGELTGSRAEEIDRLTQTDPVWQGALRQMIAVDALLDAYAIPDPPAGLADRIIQGVEEAGRPRPVVVKLARLLAPLAAAAAVLIAVLVWHSAKSGPEDRPPVAGQKIVDEELAGVPAADRPIVEHLDFARSLELCNVIADSDRLLDDETLKAIDRLEKTRHPS